MSEKRRKAIVFILCGIALIWAVLNSPIVRSDSQSVDDMTAESMAGRTETSGDMVPQSDGEVSHEWQGDPFPRGGAVHQKASSSRPDVAFKLSAISKSGSSFMAVVNGIVLSEGSTIKGWHVDAIDNESVVLSFGAAKRVLKLGR